MRRAYLLRASRAVGLGCLAAALTGTSSTVAAPCGVRAEIVASLGQRYGEVPVAAGLTSEGALLEVLASGDGSSWTIIQSAPSGTACIVAAGESWEPRGLPPAAAGGAAPDGPAL